jgi:hypothetical protein
MRAVMIETESRPVEDAAFGDGGMEVNRGRLSPTGFLGLGKIAAPLKVAPLEAPPLKFLPVAGGNIVPNSLVALGSSGLVPAEPGTTGRVLEQKLLEKMIVSRFIPPTIRTVADLPAGTRMKRLEDPVDFTVTFEIVLPTGGTFRWEADQRSLAEAA